VQKRGAGDPMFTDRRDAGRQLASRLKLMQLGDPIVLALPRGGVPVGYEIALALDAPLDVLLVRKIGYPGQPELALGAVIDGADPEIVINESAAAHLDNAEEYIEREATQQLKVIEERRRQYRGDGGALAVANATAIVVDDGAATGSTIEAALKGLKRAGPRDIIVALPVAPREVAERLEKHADHVICLQTPQPFHAVGLHYRAFAQTSDREVIELLAAAEASVADPGA
jgi:putative phosphoribosyl transferase